MQPLDRELLDAGGSVPDVKLLAHGLHDAGYPLACQGSANVVLPVIDAHASIGLHRAGKGLLVDPLQPEVRMDPLGHRRQRGKLRTSHTRRLVATGTRLVGAFFVVMDQKGLGGLLDLPVGARPMHLQALLGKRAMKSLHIRIQIGAMWRDQRSVLPRDRRGSAPVRKGNRAQMGYRRNEDRYQR
jgi:hypothetical protein